MIAFQAASKQKLQSELNLACGEGGSHGSEGRIRDIAVRRTEIRPVQGVEELASKLQSTRFAGQRELFLEREIQLIKGIAAAGVASRIAKRMSYVGRNLNRGSIEIPVDGPLASRQHRVTDEVGPIRRGEIAHLECRAWRIAE